MRCAAMLAVALASTAAAQCAPEQVRLALTAATDGSSMTVSWATGNTTTPAAYVGTVAFGSSPGALSSTSAPAISRNYTFNGYQSFYFHVTELTGLTARAAVFYQIQASAGCAASAIMNFSAAPITGASSIYPFTVAAYADMGISYSKNTAAFLTELAGSGAIDLVVHAGDISYADNRGTSSRDGGYENVQNTYWNEVSPYLSHVPGMYSSGNHEAFSAGAKESFLAYRTRVAPTMPGTAASGSPFWHSFNYGRVHFVAFDIDQPWQNGSAQYSWIAADLAAVDRAATPLVFAFQHFPLLCSNNFWCYDGSGTAQAFRKLYEPMFNAAATRVHMYLSGHVHAAEIMYPLATDALVPSQTDFTKVQTVFQVMAGFPGDEEVCCNSWQKPRPSWSAWRLDDVDADGGTFGFSMWTFKSDSEVSLSFWNAENRTLLTTVDVTFA